MILKQHSHLTEMLFIVIRLSLGYMIDLPPDIFVVQLGVRAFASILLNMLS